ncbi:AraC family transcriptional regulator [Loktanella sp. D2R18]|uniref:AraC family transcriptional regulator n=1 Tax=Loktanella sp. D2R18 TaxID=2267230 RepID=UPI0015EFE4FD|nr:AraC family transcriptional regulator [Loktanella sp. D2R18]
MLGIISRSQALAACPALRLVHSCTHLFQCHKRIKALFGGSLMPPKGTGKKVRKMDPLSDVLELIGFRSSIYFQKNFCGNWKMSVSDTGFAQFHYIVRGTAVIEHDGHVENLTAGDLVLFPKGASHAICDNPDSPATSGQDVIAGLQAGDEPFLDGAPTTRMICGHFQYDLAHQHPLVKDLPPRILLKTSEMELGTLLSSLISLIVNETLTKEIGSRTVTQYLSQALFASILRAHFVLEGSQIGFYSGIRDARIVSALSAIHEPDGWKYNLADLASIAGMSRSSFAAIFKSHMGQTPGDYALNWRMFKARRSLEKPGQTIDQIAHDCGYGSSSAFSRAFRAVMGVNPSQLRTTSH